jgi:hypothetical protein
MLKDQRATDPKKNGGTEKEKVKTRRRKLQPRNRSPKNIQHGLTR